MASRKAIKWVTPKEYAKLIGKPYTTVMTWLQRGLLAGARRQDTPTGHYWEVPESQPPPQLQRGRKKAAPKK